MEEETFDDWIQRLADGEIERPEEFAAIGKWLEAMVVAALEEAAADSRGSAEQVDQ